MSIRKRFWVEVGMSAASALLVLMTLLWRDWIEIVFRVDPDHGDGSLEWVIAGAFVLSATGFSLIARREFRMYQASTP